MNDRETTFAVRQVKKVEKSFIDYFVEKQKIDTQAVECIRTCGWGEKAVLRVEYATHHKDYKPIRLAKQYLREFHGYFPKSLNFNNVHFDRIGCSALYLYDISKEDFDKYHELPNICYPAYNEEKNYGMLGFVIHNARQCELSYERRLYEYFEQ
jgi:hypothetical protein